MKHPDSRLGIWILALAASSCAPRFIHTDRSFYGYEVVTPPVIAHARTTPEGDTPCLSSTAEVSSMAVYSPDPDPAQIARAWPRGEDELQATIAYCINIRGKPEALEVVGRSGFDAIDRACVQALTDWRWKPHILQGERVRSCASMTFRIRALRPRRGR